MSPDRLKREVKKLLKTYYTNGSVIHHRYVMVDSLHDLMTKVHGLELTKPKLTRIVRKTFPSVTVVEKKRHRLYAGLAQKVDTKNAYQYAEHSYSRVKLTTQTQVNQTKMSKEGTSETHKETSLSDSDSIDDAHSNSDSDPDWSIYTDDEEEFGNVSMSGEEILSHIPEELVSNEVFMDILIQKMQSAAAKDNKRSHRFSPQSFHFGSTLLTSSKKSYDVLRSQLNLPSERQLQHHKDLHQEGQGINPDQLKKAYKKPKKAHKEPAVRKRVRPSTSSQSSQGCSTSEAPPSKSRSRLLQNKQKSSDTPSAYVERESAASYNTTATPDSDSEVYCNEQGCPGSEDDVEWIQCDCCDAWYHRMCAGVKESLEILRKEDWVCQDCPGRSDISEDDDEDQCWTKNPSSSVTIPSPALYCPAVLL